MMFCYKVIDDISTLTKATFSVLIINKQTKRIKRYTFVCLLKINTLKNSSQSRNVCDFVTENCLLIFQCIYLIYNFNQHKEPNQAYRYPCEISPLPRYL